MAARKTTPGPSEAVHVSRDNRRAFCGQDMRGEPELPQGATVTCPKCCRRNGHHNCGCPRRS